MITIGLVGCGSMGAQLARAIQGRFKKEARLTGLCDSNLPRARRLASSLRPRVPVLSLQQLMTRSQLLLEAASPQAVRQILPQAARRRRPVLVMSAGGLLGLPGLLDRMRERKIPIYLPSGALVGLDGIKAAAVGKIRSVMLTTRKPPAAFTGAPEVVRRRLQMERIRKPTLLYQGSAAGAARGFPQNLNVAATLSLAGIGPTRTRVRIIADPTCRRNVHELEVVGSFGRFRTRTENISSRENPKTSQLAIQSAIARLGQILDSFQVGT